MTDLHNTLGAGGGHTAAAGPGSSVDDEILHATEDYWMRKQMEGAERCKKFELDHWMRREELEAMTVEDYLINRYYDADDKKGKEHWRNMIASIMQSDKSTAGSSFEAAIMDLAEKNGVEITGQVTVNEKGVPCRKRDGGVHKIDGYISREARPADMRDCYIISKKTTLRERWNQDVWCVPICKKVLLLTREVPNPSTLDSIRLHKVIVVYPHAPITDYSWSYQEFFRKMKMFQDGISDGF